MDIIEIEKLLFEEYFIDAIAEFTYKTDLINKAKTAFAKYNLAYSRLLDLEQKQLGH
ncbi:MAG: hypothetical protein WBA39_16460 [Rivularia sp. (in: cyanobacteria)]